MPRRKVVENGELPPIEGEARAKLSEMMLRLFGRNKDTEILVMQLARAGGLREVERHIGNLRRYAARMGK
jgi:hypothetical protein